MRSSTLYSAPAVRRRSCLLLLSACAVAGLALRAPGAARADTPAPVYRSTPLIISGDRAGAARIPASSGLYVEGLTDAGQVLFSAAQPIGYGADLLFEWNGGQFTPILGHVVGSGIWLSDVNLDRPVSVNRSGSAVFSTCPNDSVGPWTTYRWNAATQSVTPVLKNGMPATGQHVFTQAGGVAPAINNGGEMALIGQIKAPGGPSGYGLFWQLPGQPMEPVLLPGQHLPRPGRGEDVATTTELMLPSMNGLGDAAFLTRVKDGSGYGAYLWDYEGILPVALPGQQIAGAGKITNVGSISLNIQDQGAFIAATTDQGDRTHWGLYRVAGGKITTVAAPGTAMPGGGTLATLQSMFTRQNSPAGLALSNPNRANQRVFLATLQDGTAGAYAVDATGHMSLVFATNPHPAPVTIQEVGYSMTFETGSRPCLNNHGQVALSVRIKSGRSMIVLLTPAASS